MFVAAEMVHLFLESYHNRTLSLVASDIKPKPLIRISPVIYYELKKIFSPLNLGSGYIQSKKRN